MTKTAPARTISGSFDPTRSIAAALAAGMLVGCAIDVEPTTEQAVHPIVNGTFDGEDAAVVALGDQSGVTCGGVLVSRWVVVTAGHCLRGAIPAWVYFGADVNALGKIIPVASVRAHPQFDAFLNNDIGVVVLSAPIDEIEPIPLATSPPMVGGTARFVGFGYTGPGQTGEHGRKYQTSARILAQDFSATTFGYGKATCHGDSGGPAFSDDGTGGEVVAGITSWGDTDCSVFGVDTRVDAFGDFIAGAIDLAECEAGGGCPTPDPDPGDDAGSGCGAAPDPGGLLAVAVCLGLRGRRRRSMITTISSPTHGARNQPMLGH